jgi:hypothetical protein
VQVLGIVACACFAVAIGLLTRLHLQPTQMQAVRDAVSDYGTTRFHRNYRAMAVAMGVGAILLAIGLARETDAHALVWLWVYGASRIAISGFMTDRDPPPFTAEGRIHWLLAAAAFTAIALAASNIEWSGDPNALDGIGRAVVLTAIATLATRVVAPLRPVFGLVERLLYVSSFAWLVVAAIDLAGT